MNCFYKNMPFLIALLLFAKVAHSIDENNNNLDDAWEQRYNASTLNATDDEDNDGFDNSEECIAGTDPYDANNYPKVTIEVVRDGAQEIQLLFETFAGKNYTLFHSSDLQSFDEMGKWPGNDSEKSLLINTDGTSESISPIKFDFWADLPGETIDALYLLDRFPSPPDGSIHYVAPEAPVFEATGYGARMTTWITPPQTGIYTFFISAGGPAELYLSSPGIFAPSKIAEILPTQTGLNKGEWDVYPTQRAEILELTANTNYFLDLRYVSVVPYQHVQVAWSGPGLDGIQPLKQSDLATVAFHSKTSTGSILLQHNYDDSGQTGRLWPQNTEIETSILGMSGNSERILGDVGASGQEEHININPNEIDYEHLYATWLFNMSPGEQETYIFFQNGLNSSQEGPNINIKGQNSKIIVEIRAGGPTQNDAVIDVEFDKTYRIEMLATLAAQGFEYEAPTGKFTVSEDTFDIYVSDPEGNLVGFARGLAFRDGPGIIEALNNMRLPNLKDPLDPRAPNVVFDDWEFTSGLITGKGYLTPNNVDFSSNASGHFFKLKVEEADQDGDGLKDSTEFSLGSQYSLLFFDSETSNGTADYTELASILSGSQGLPEVELCGTDAAAFESNYPSTIPDDGEITITRTGTQAPLTVRLSVAPLENTGSTVTVCDGSCCMLIGSAGDEEAESEDYQLIDENGTVITDTVTFEFGEMKKILTVKAVNDAINEYPETLNVVIAPSTDGSYTVSDTLNGASIQIFDLPDSADNITIFTGTFSAEPGVATNGSGFLTATLNGPRTELRISNEFSGLTSAQQDSHVHKSNDGDPGNIIYAITTQPGNDETNPLNGPLDNYLWDLTDSSGAIPSTGSGGASKQVIIDSLFGQNGESPLYLNVHTEEYPAGEIWAFLRLSGGGSITAPGAPTPAAAAGSAEYPQLSGELLEAEVRRFLNQATFGATDDAVEALLNTIETARLSNPNYHRHQAYSEWIDNQMDPEIYRQTYLLDFTLAGTFQMMTLAGIFDTALNPTDGTTPTPIRPVTWPTINRSDPNPEYWYLSDTFPISWAEFTLSRGNLQLSSGNNERRHAHWQTMLNAKDQLRQKMGFALQQIVVASAESITIRDNSYGSANYQDLINTHAFDYYRDILGFVNWSPIMAYWLSSLQNQKATDFDGDGLFDTFPDENLARENMQLFSIGLFQIWPDGTLKLSAEGLPQPNYTNDDIREFAKILTGQSFSFDASTIPTWGGIPFVADNDDFFSFSRARGLLIRSYLYPMKMFGDYHALGTKSFAGATIDNTDITDPAQQGIADIEAAIDWLAGKPGDSKPDFDMVSSHVSTPAFISRRLIQRFTTSNPSRDYLHRVATVFKDSEGNLGLTLKAILLDPEARTLDLSNKTFGMKKSPLEAYIQMLRTLEAYTYIPLENPNGAAPYNEVEAVGDYTNPDLYLETFQYPGTQLANHERNVRFMQTNAQGNDQLGLQIDPFRQLTVFNYYLPDYFPGGAVGNAGLVAPELQLANENGVVKNINYFYSIILGNLGLDADKLGDTIARQNVAFGFTDADDTQANKHSRIRLPFQQMVDAFYPVNAPTPIVGDPLVERSSESLADEALLDALDKRLTCGLFKLRYPYDRSDDDDPNIAGLDDLLKNPRELIIDSVAGVYGDPYDGNNDDQDRINKLKNILYLLTLSPEYQVKK